MLIVIVLIAVQVARPIEHDMYIRQLRLLAEFLHIFELMDESEMLANDVQSHISMPTQQAGICNQSDRRAVD